MRLYHTSKAPYSQAVRWITGFNGLAYQNNKINPIDFPSPNRQLCDQLIKETSSHLIGSCPSLLWERLEAFKTVHFLESFEEIKIIQLLHFLGYNRVKMMQNISEYPLLFVEDYENVHHNILDIMANHETSLPSRNDDNNSDGEDDGRF